MRRFSRCVGAEVLHGGWAMLAVFGGLALWIFDEVVGLGYAESLRLKGVKPMAFEVHEHDIIFGGTVWEDYLIAMLGCQVVFVSAVRES